MKDLFKGHHPWLLVLVIAVDIFSALVYPSELSRLDAYQVGLVRTDTINRKMKKGEDSRCLDEELLVG